MINKTGKFIIERVEWIDPVLTPMLAQPILIYCLWQGTPTITIPLIVESQGAKRALNLENIPIDKIEFDVANPQDLNVLLGRISAKFDEAFKLENQ